jgi:hypothetical protein
MRAKGIPRQLGRYTAVAECIRQWTNAEPPNAVSVNTYLEPLMLFRWAGAIVWVMVIVEPVNVAQSLAMVVPAHVEPPSTSANVVFGATIVTLLGDTELAYPLGTSPFAGSK